MAQAPQPQVQEDLAVPAFQDLRLELIKVTPALTLQGISDIVSKFDGNPKHFREWIKSIDKYAVLVNADDERKKILLTKHLVQLCLDSYTDTCKLTLVTHGIR